jgi:branched-chain amino acid aminotransferase
MAIQATEFIWHRGELVRWDEAKVHVLTHALHYGSSIFEGIRVYKTPHRGPCFFRLREHVDRLFASARIYAMKLPFTKEQIHAACHEVVAKNGLESAYVRPIAFHGYGSIGVLPGPNPAEVSIAAIEWGRYLGEEGIEKGVDVCISSWRRMMPGTLPALAKAGGNYLSSQLVAAEAKRNGYHEGIALGPDGTVCEGSGENVFLVRAGAIRTPSLASSILEGITRHTVLTIARELGIQVMEGAFPRELLLVADEIFLTGTAAEITPVRSVDRQPIGAGERGPITKSIQDRFFGLFDGSVEDAHGWLEEVRG